MLNKLIHYLLDSLSPAACRLCLGRLPPDQQLTGICLVCQTQLPWLRHCCSQCALPLPANHADATADTTTDTALSITPDTVLDTTHATIICGECLHQPPAFERTIAAFNYLPPISHLIHNCKDRHQLADGKLLSRWLAEHLRHAYRTRTEIDQPSPTAITDYADLPDAIIPVPLHWQRQLTRGFNQTAYIASCLSKELDIPLLNTGRRLKATPKQQNLNRRQRLKNLRNAFHINADVTGLHLAVVDDVMTTGSTLRELSASLKAAGATRVDAWVIARTPR